LSPDGRWVAYTSNESGSDEVYVQSFPVPGGKRRVSSDGGAMPPDGQRFLVRYPPIDLGPAITVVINWLAALDG
jgi:Tol biopolymer transport system component